MYQYYLKARNDQNYDLIILIRRQEAEFGLDFFSGRSDFGAYERFVQYLTEQNKRVKIKTIQIFISGLLVAVIPFSTAAIAAAESRHFFSITDSVLYAADEAIRSDTKFNMTYLYGGTVSQQIEQVEAVGSFQTVSPGYFNIDAQGNLSLNAVNTTLIDRMHKQNIKVVPFLSNHWDRSAGERALDNPQRLAAQIVDAIEQYNLDGVNVDIENVTARYRDAYTELVRLLRESLPAEKEVSVAVAANPNGWTAGWHGSYDYAALAKYADYLMIMAYDEHWETGSPGPVASITFAQRSIEYALKYAPAEKLVLGIPFYGRVWSEDGNFNGNGVSIRTLEKLLDEYDAEITYSETEQSPKAEFTVHPGDKVYSINGKKLTPGKYTVWFEDERSLESKIQLIHQYDIKGLGSWTLTQATDSVLGQLTGWLQGAEEETPVSLTGTVTASSLRIREAPNTTSETIGYLAQGETVSIVGSLNGWYRIQLENGKNGFVSADYIEIIEEEIMPPVTTRTGYSSGSNVRVRNQASTSSAIITTLNKGDSFTVVGDIQNGWYAVQLSNGSSGFIHGDYVTFTKPVTARTGYSSGSNVRVRSQASTSSSIITTLNKGDSFTVVGDIQNGWYAVQLSNGSSGFIHGDYVTFTKPVTARMGYSSGSNVRVRSQASTSSSIITTLNKGDSFTVVGDIQNGWYAVRLSNGSSGFIHGDYVSFRK